MAEAVKLLVIDAIRKTVSACGTGPPVNAAPMPPACTSSPPATNPYASPGWPPRAANLAAISSALPTVYRHVQPRSRVVADPAAAIRQPADPASARSSVTVSSARSSSRQPALISNRAWAGEATPGQPPPGGRAEDRLHDRQQPALLTADRPPGARHVLQHLQMQLLGALEDLAVAAAGLADDPHQRRRQPRLALLARGTRAASGSSPARARSRRAGPARSRGSAPPSSGCAGSPAGRDPWPGSTGTAWPPRRPRAGTAPSSGARPRRRPRASRWPPPGSGRACRAARQSTESPVLPVAPANPLSGIRSAFRREPA